ncbi:MAG: cupin domain-containing protein [Mahellales bacterium]|jgi:mannose-6-phosphate isomerase-like protein (cupin superfamily)
MIRKVSDMVKEVRERMRGGSGHVEIQKLLSEDEIKAKTRLCAKLTLQPGCSIGYHEHVGEDEIFYIIKGEGRVNDNGTMKQVAAGDVILTGNGAGHAIENTGDTSLEIMAIILLYS